MTPPDVKRPPATTPTGAQEITATNDDHRNRTSQLTLFAEPSARRADPPTSVAAAQAVRAASGALEQEIVAAYRTHGPLCDDELVVVLADRHGPTVITARSRLARRGVVVPTSAQRLSRRGRPQIVWRLA